MNSTEIYNLLAAGKTLELEFSTQQEAETLRIRLHHLKSRAESHLIDVGMMAVEDTEVLSFVRNDNMRLKFTARFIKIRSRKEYAVTIIDDSP